MGTKDLFKKSVIFVTLSSFLLWNYAVATPQGGTVAQGSAVISNPSSTQTVINQSSQNAVINWNSFNTASNQSVRFNQPSSSAVALNRITSGLPTTFAGQLTANGQVWILNPAGVLFTNTSKIDVSGLVATTLNIQDSDFMAGNYNLSQSPNYPQGKVINNGNITIENDGLVALVAPTVVNRGTITANMGTVVLASGTVATLDPYGDNLIEFAPNNYAVNGSITNKGTITANGGRVLMTANSINNVIKDVVNDGGMIEANNAIQSSNGVIILGGNSGTTNITGTIKSNNITIKGNNTVISGNLTTPAGGTIETSGDTVTISPDAVINPGQGGLWYLDPLTIDIAADYGNIIQNELQNGTNVTLSTGVSGATAGSGDISVDQAITWGSGASLTLMAANNIIVTQAITSTAPSASNVQVTLHADAAATGGTVSFSGLGHVTSNGGVTIYYYPTAYTSPTNFAPYVTLANPNFLTPFMTIDSLTDLINVSDNLSNYSQNYLLNTDITLPSLGGFFPFGIFTGTFTGIFDGHDYVTGVNHTITNVDVYANSTPNGFMGGLASINNGTIENLNVNGSVGTEDVTPVASAVGGIAGVNNGTISDVTFEGAIEAGAGFGGGIAGINTGTIVTSGSSGLITAQLTNGGGIAGEASGIIWNDYSWSTINTGGGIVGEVYPNSNLNLNLVYYNGDSTGIAAFVEVVPSSSTLTLTTNLDGKVNYVYNITNCPTCTNSNVTNYGVFNSSQITNQTLWEGISTFNFVNTWTTNGNTTAPTIIPDSVSNNSVLGAGDLSSPAVQNVSIYGGGTLIGTNVSDPEGDFIWSYNPDVVASPYYLATTNGATVQGTILQATASTSVPVTHLDITNDTVEVNGDAGLSNANLAVAAADTPSTTPYTASGNNLTLDSGISFLTTASTPYNLNGDITVPSGDITLDGTSTSALNSVLLTASDTITLGGVLTSTAPSGNHSVILDADSFMNNVGPTAIDPGAGNSFLIYLSTPVGSTFNGLDSNDQAIWDQTITSLPPANVPSGSYYIFALQPTATITTTSAVKSYGTDLTGTGPGTVGSQYSGSGFVDASLYGNVFTQDTVSNSFINYAPTSPGAAPTASVAGSPYPVTVPNNIMPTTGYNVIINNAGTITVYPALLTIDSVSQTKNYGEELSKTTTSFSTSGLQNGENIATVDILSNGLASTASVFGSPYPIIMVFNAQGGTANLANYLITYNPLGTITVLPDTASADLYVGIPSIDHLWLVDTNGLDVCGASGCDNLDLVMNDEIYVSSACEAATVIDKNGSTRLVMKGDRVFVGETIVTPPADAKCPKTKLCMIFPDGSMKCLGANARYKV